MAIRLLTVLVIWYFELSLCVDRGEGESEQKTCYNCGSTEHLAKDCPEGSSYRRPVCYICKKPGHKAFECRLNRYVYFLHYWFVERTDLRRLFSGMCCFDLLTNSYKCNKPGHLARDCEGETVCRNCGKTGHLSYECPNEAVCRNCGKPGHIARDCENEPVCRNCGESGHIARECRN